MDELTSFLNIVISVMIIFLLFDISLYVAYTLLLFNFKNSLEKHTAYGGCVVRS